MIKILKHLTKTNWILISISVLFIVFQVWLDLKMPDYMAKITVLVQTQGSDIKDILTNGFYMILCAFGSLIGAIIVGYLVAKLASGFSMNLRKKIFRKVQKMSMQNVKKFEISSLITRTTNDITQIEVLIVMGIQLLIKAPITAIWAITKILNKNWQWSALTALSVIILLSAISIIIIIVTPRFKIIQKLTDKLNKVTRENLKGIRVIRAFNAENFQENKFQQVNDELTKTQLFNQKTFAILTPLMYLVMYLLTLSIYFIGAFIIKDAIMADKLILFGDMIVFSSYAIQVIMSFLMLAMIFMILPRSQVSAKRINEVLDTSESIVDGHINKNISNEKGTIVFDNVSFKYPDAEEYILKNISFKINQGETVAFIGSTGSGKSTLINLIPRFYDIEEGKILINGINIKEYSQNFLHSKIGYVPQKAVIFNGSVNYNISYGSNNLIEITDKQIKKAVKIAQVEDFVLSMKNKYDTKISSGGTNISGGQKQRISIARAIARNPEIYIFDDSFSALDYKTDTLLRKEIKKHAQKTTILIVAQRIGTIMNADKIIVLENGNIVGIGKHEELLKNCEVYKQIALSQLSKEEL